MAENKYISRASRSFRHLCYEKNYARFFTVFSNAPNDVRGLWRHLLSKWYEIKVLVIFLPIEITNESM